MALLGVMAESLLRFSFNDDTYQTIMQLLTTLRSLEIAIPPYASHHWNDLPNIMKIMAKNKVH